MNIWRNSKPPKDSGLHTGEYSSCLSEIENYGVIDVCVSAIDPSCESFMNLLERLAPKHLQVHAWQSMRLQIKGLVQLPQKSSITHYMSLVYHKNKYYIHVKEVFKKLRLSADLWNRSGTVTNKAHWRPQEAGRVRCANQALCLNPGAGELCLWLPPLN